MNLANTAIMMTAWRRPHYLRRTLRSWAKVDGVRDVATFTVCLDPSDRLDAMLEVIQDAQDDGLPVTAHINPERYGVSVNPAEGGSMIFHSYPEVDYLVLAEEDLIVADDTLRYFAWVNENFRDTRGVLIACAHSPDDPDPEADPAMVVLLPRFRVWVWATWRDRWFRTLEPTWDRSYNTGTVGHQECGFDFNIDLRVIPEGGYVCALPAASRSQNIGRFEGVHSDPNTYAKTLNWSFQETFGEPDYYISSSSFKTGTQNSSRTRSAS